MRTKAFALLAAALLMGGCSSAAPDSAGRDAEPVEEVVVTDAPAEDPAPSEDAPAEEPAPPDPAPDELYAALDIVQDIRPELDHGPKTVEYQRYIVLHDTEGDSGPEDTVAWWAGNGNLVAAHFVVGKDGHIVQCVPLVCLAHHAGYGDTGHNELYGIEEDGRDDMLGTVPIGSNFADYGMNAWSVGIEIVHVGGSGPYPEEQLEALDGLIAYIDAYFGVECQIIDHKAWRSGNSDTSAEFAEHLANYQDHGTHD